MVYTFDDKQQYLQYFKTNKLEVTKNIVEGIDYSLEHELSSALVFELNFKGTSVAYEITIDKEDWEKTLDACLEIFTEFEDADGAIDTYLVKKKLIT